jgi:hypothetical protein
MSAEDRYAIIARIETCASDVFDGAARPPNRIDRSAAISLRAGLTGIRYARPAKK